MNFGGVVDIEPPDKQQDSCISRNASKFAQSSFSAYTPIRLFFAFKTVEVTINHLIVGRAVSRAEDHPVALIETLIAYGCQARFTACSRRPVWMISANFIGNPA